MTEFELIYRYFKAQEAQAVNTGPTKIVKDLGDDAAIIAMNAPTQWVTCVDTLIQGRHFSEDWRQVSDLAFAIGYKAVVVNVSDILAMGAKPHSILLALSLPERLANEVWLAEFAKGLFHACAQYGVRLIGGDTTRNDKLVISITANGVLATATPPVYRSGAKVGDKVYASGTLGDASYALYYPDTEVGKHLGHRLHMPTPRSALAQKLANSGLVTAMMDISDGLVQDLGHICQQSNVAIQLELDKLPTSKPLQRVDLAQRLRCQLIGGDDYELVFTLPAEIEPSQQLLASVVTEATCIGEVIAADNLMAEGATPRPDNSDAATIKLLYQGKAVTKQTPYPFDEFPDLRGFQHFTQ